MLEGVQEGVVGCWLIRVKKGGGGGFEPAVLVVDRQAPVGLVDKVLGVSEFGVATQRCLTGEGG